MGGGPAIGPRVRVDPTACIGSGMCTAVAPGRFRLAGAVAEAEPGDVPVGEQAAVHAAVALCPGGAIALDGPSVDPTHG